MRSFFSKVQELNTLQKKIILYSVLIIISLFFVKILIVDIKKSLEYFMTYYKFQLNERTKEITTKIGEISEEVNEKIKQSSNQIIDKIEKDGSKVSNETSTLVTSSTSNFLSNFDISSSGDNK